MNPITTTLTVDVVTLTGYVAALVTVFGYVLPLFIKDSGKLAAAKKTLTILAAFAATGVVTFAPAVIVLFLAKALAVAAASSGVGFGLTKVGIGGGVAAALGEPAPAVPAAPGAGRAPGAGTAESGSDSAV